MYGRLFFRKHRNAYVFLWTWGVGVYLAEIVSESAWTFFFLVPVWVVGRLLGAGAAAQHSFQIVGTLLPPSRAL